ncbi:integrase core domain-containing protein [Celeribacter sp.]|uniref:integrase core domain-containing protein n=1 Tax=Celeribacter sp. TaxID=1890673 RepID=UPI003A91E730
MLGTYRAALRSLKQDAIYLEKIADGFHARREIRRWMTFYNTEHPHSSLEHRTPRKAYWNGRDQKMAT